MTTSNPTAHKTTGRKQRSKLDRAIIASVVAVLAMNVFVLAQQLNAAPAFAAANDSAPALQA